MKQGITFGSCLSDDTFWRRVLLNTILKHLFLKAVPANSSQRSFGPNKH